MEWTPGEVSKDIEDRRGEGGAGGGGGFGFGHLGIGGILVVGLLSLIFHQNFFALFSGDSAATRPSPAARSQLSERQPAQRDPQVLFMSSSLMTRSATGLRSYPERLVCLIATPN
jgi:predicted metalloprotease